MEGEVSTNKDRVKYDPRHWILIQTPEENTGCASWLLIMNKIKKNKKAGQLYVTSRPPLPGAGSPHGKKDHLGGTITAEHIAPEAESVNR